MKFCTNCGTELGEQQKFCKKCGTKTSYQEEILQEQGVVTSPIATDAVATQPVATQPVATQAVATQPVATQPVATQAPSGVKRSSYRKMIAAVVAVAAVLGLAYFYTSPNTSADSMRLEAYEGDLTLLNGATEKAVSVGQRLASQDNLETYLESNAYISLDNTKLLKLDQTSQIEIVESNNKLEVEVLKGSLYFNVSKPLDDHESLTFYCNNIVTGVRGTSGVITYLDSIDQSEIVLFSGSVEIETNETTQQTETVSAGEVAIVSTREDESVEVVIKKHEEVPGFHFSQGFLEDEEDIIFFEEYIGNPWKKEYIDHLRSINGNYSGLEVITPLLVGFYGSAMVEQMEYCLHDMDLDGIPELFLRYLFYDTHDHEEEDKRLSGVLVFGEFGDTYSLHEISGTFGNQKVGSRSEIKDSLVIPHDGKGLYAASADISLVNDGFFSSDLVVGSIRYNNTQLFFDKTEEGFQKIVLSASSPDPYQALWLGGTELGDLTWYPKDDWRPLIDW
ncbi:MAG: FecR domain-containing protein [Eubacteriales bacterium]